MQATVMVRYSLLASVVLAAGCSNYWGRRPVDQPTPIHSGDPVWIWTKRGVEKWRAVVITQDSVSGIPFETSRKCVVCRRSIPRGSGGLHEARLPHARPKRHRGRRRRNRAHPRRGRIVLSGGPE